MRQYQTDSAQTDLMKGNLLYHILGLISEVGELAPYLITKDNSSCDILSMMYALGELASKRKKESRDNGKELSYTFLNGDIGNFSKELGDINWYFNQIANDLNLDIEDLEQENLKKLLDRMRRGVIKGNGDNR